MRSRFLWKPLTVKDLGLMLPQPPVCDFCGVHAPSTLYAATHTSEGQAINCWRWAACPDCHALVEDGNWQTLLRQITETLRPNMTDVPDAVLDDAAVHALTTFLLYAQPRV